MTIFQSPLTQFNAVELALLEAQSEQELANQREIVVARKYHYGDQAAKVTDRLKEFLPSIALGEDFRLNICRVIVSAMIERMRIIGWDASDDQKIVWATDLFDDNKGPVVELDLYETLLRDGEAFVVVDFDSEQKTISWHVNPRFTSLDVDGGDGYGCKAFYENDDPNQKLLYVVKEYATFEDNGKVTRYRIIYFPNRIVRYRHNGVEFVQYREDDWIDSQGNPLGVAAVHFYNKGFKREAEDAYSPQDAINKTFLDLLTASDLTAFRIFVTLGWIPTTDGKEPAEDQSNWMPIQPGALVGTTKNKSEASFEAIEPADPEYIIKTVQQIILWASMVTNTPASRFIATKLIASDETLKQQEEPLVAKIDAVKTLLSYSWRRVFILTESVWNVLNPDQTVPEGKVKPIWCHSASIESLMAILLQKQLLGVPKKQLWREMGYDQQKIATLETERQQELALATQQTNNNNSEQ